MSSGSELLRRLRKQQQPSLNHRTKTQHEKNRGSGAERTAAVTVSTTNDVAIPERTSSWSSLSSSRNGGTNTTINTATNINTNTNTRTTIEVCLGPDCSGSGGGAALLEIEELVSSCRGKLLSKSKSSQGNNSDGSFMDMHMHMDVIPGGCRDFCTMGPNVLVKKSTSSTGRNGIIDAHYSKVDGPEACRDIVASALGAVTVTTTSSSSSTATMSNVGGDDNSAMAGILKRREDGMRWRSHRKRAARERRLRVRERERPST